MRECMQRKKGRNRRSIGKERMKSPWRSMRKERKIAIVEVYGKKKSKAKKECRKGKDKNKL